MKLTTRNITEKDWSMLCSWWEGHKWPIPNNDALPDNGKKIIRQLWLDLYLKQIQKVVG
jgi:hypothetical protein